MGMSIEYMKSLNIKDVEKICKAYSLENKVEFPESGVAVVNEALYKEIIKQFQQKLHLKLIHNTGKEFSYNEILLLEVVTALNYAKRDLQTEAMKDCKSEEEVETILTTWQDIVFF